MGKIYKKLTEKEAADFEKLLNDKVFTPKELVEVYCVASDKSVISIWKSKRAYPAYLKVFLEVSEMKNELQRKDIIIRKLIGNDK